MLSAPCFRKKPKSPALKSPLWGKVGLGWTNVPEGNTEMRNLIVPYLIIIAARTNEAKGFAWGNMAFGSPNAPVIMDRLGQAHLARGGLRPAF